MKVQKTYKNTNVPLYPPLRKLSNDRKNYLRVKKLLDVRIFSINTQEKAR